MKKLTLFLILLLLPCLAEARMPMAVVGSGEIANECDNTLVCQNFEGTGYDHSESWTEAVTCATTSTCDEDYTGTVLRGAQSLLMDYGVSEASTYVGFTANDEISGHLMLRVLTDTTGILIKISNNTASLFTIGYHSNNKYYDGTNLGATSFTVPVTHYCWFYYKKGTGADEINRWWFSTTRTFPGGTPDIEVTNGTSTAQANRIYLGDFSNSSAIFDQVIIKAGTAGLENIQE
jgi:hypothetical protein